jgi:hypothetical protein
MTLFSHPFTRKRVVVSVIAVSVVAASLMLAHRPTSAHRLQRTVPVHYIVDRPDGSLQPRAPDGNRVAPGSVSSAPMPLGAMRMQ